MAKIEYSALETEFNRAYDEYKYSIYSFCMARLHCNADEAEDCVQETFSVYFDRLRRGEEFSNPRAFLYKTASNLIKKAQAKQSKRLRMEISLSQEDGELELGDKPYVDDDRLILQQLQERIEELLTPEEQELFEKRFIDDISVKDIARELGITAGNCSIRIYRIRARLQDGLKDYL